MNEFLILVALMSCQQSPTDPSRSVSDGGPGIEVQDANWEGVLEVDLETFDTTEELRADRRVFATGNLNLDQVHLDREVAFVEGGLTRSMRYDWTDQGPNSISIGRGIMLPHEVQELWAEVVIRFSRNYSPCNPAKPPCAHKILFFYVAPDGNERWDVRTGGSGEIGPEVHLTMSAPFGEAEGHPDWNTWGVVRALRSIDSPRPQLTLANQYFDEEWHTLRLYARHSTDEKTFDARMAMWMDGELLYDSESMHRQYGTPRFSTKDGARIRSILIGRNKDNGLDRGTESVWVGRIRAWKDDPGWLQ